VVDNLVSMVMEEPLAEMDRTALALDTW